MKLNPLDIIEPLNVRTDRRHDRRALEMEEFMLLLQAAETGPCFTSLLHGRDSGEESLAV
jgi:hypothetical protein